MSHGSLAFVVLTFGRSFLYHPTHAEADALAGGGFSAVRLAARDGVSLRGLVRPAREAEAPWVVFFAGNAMSLRDSKGVLELMAPSAATGLAAFAYRGYDGSEGEPGEPELCADAVQVVDHLASAYGVAPSRLVVAGQSLGTGIAAHVAAELARRGTPARGTILISPYTSMAQVFDDHVPIIPVGAFVSDKYQTERLVPVMVGPVLIVHGARDEVVGVQHGRALARSLGSRVRYVELAELGHNDLWNDERVLTVTRDFVRRPASP